MIDEQVKLSRQEVRKYIDEVIFAESYLPIMCLDEIMTLFDEQIEATINIFRNDTSRS